MRASALASLLTPNASRIPMKVFEHLDATLKLPQDEAMLVESVRRLARGTIAPRAEQYDRSGEFPHANVQAINA